MVIHVGPGLWVGGESDGFRLPLQCKMKGDSCTDWFKTCLID